MALIGKSTISGIIINNGNILFKIWGSLSLFKLVFSAPNLGRDK